MPTEREWVDSDGDVFTVEATPDGCKLVDNHGVEWVEYNRLADTLDLMGALMPRGLMVWFLSVVEEGSKGDAD